MPGSLNISLASKSLSSGTAEERATFGLLSIAANGRLLTEGARIGGRPVLRDGPYVSGYPLAEWLVWNPPGPPQRMHETIGISPIE